MENQKSLQPGTYKPFKFFFMTYLITWATWFTAAFFSYRENGETIYVLFMIPGLVAPFGIALWMILASKDEFLKKGFKEKLFNLKLIKRSSILPMLLIMPATVITSILASTLFGQSIKQLNFSESFSFSAGFMPVLLVLFLAASFEELGWRSYAMDSLRVKHNYFIATLIFAFLWAFWHFPLYFIHNYYHNLLIRENSLFALNFIVSVFPMAFIISWLCLKNGGSITTAILFHFIINLSQEALQMTQTTKCIETVILIIIAGIIVLTHKSMFFDNPKEEMQ